MRFILVTQLIIGIWIVVAPWILGYASLQPALWGSIVTGAVVALLSLWGLFGVDDHISN